METQTDESQRKRTQKDYSLPFKMEVISEVEKGLLSWKQAQGKYGIQGRSTVLVWLRKHGTLDWQSKEGMGKAKDVAKNTPATRIRELEARVRRLEAEKRILNSAIDLADELFATDIRKKCLPLSLSAAGKGQIQRQEKQEDAGQPEV
jgi:transposase